MEPTALLWLSLLAPQAAAQAPRIEHEGVGCVVADEHPILEARVDPSLRVARARIYFRTEAEVHWYSVPMKRAEAVLSGFLPKPQKRLQRFEYYIEVTAAGFGASRTPEYAPSVVAGRHECEGQIVAGALTSASVSLEFPPGAPAVPAGFSSGGVVAAVAEVGALPTAGAGISAKTLVILTGAAAAATGAAVAIRRAGEKLPTGRFAGNASGATARYMFAGAVEFAGCLYEATFSFSFVTMTISEVDGTAVFETGSTPTLSVGPVLSTPPLPFSPAPCSGGGGLGSTQFALDLGVAGANVTGSGLSEGQSMRMTLEGTRSGKGIQGSYRLDDNPGGSPFVTWVTSGFGSFSVTLSQ